MALGNAPQRVVDMVRGLRTRLRYTLSDQEQALAIYLQGNEALLKALTNLVIERIKGRELKEVPSDPVECKTSMARDKELRWVISRLEYICHSPLKGEQPE